MLGNNNHAKKTGIMSSVYPSTSSTYWSTYKNRFTEYKPIGSAGLSGGWMNIQPATPKHTKSA